MDAIELVYDFFEDRPHASALIRQRRPAALGLAAILVGAAALFTAQALTGRGALPFGWPGLALSMLWHATMVFLSAAVLHLILEMGGARGDARALFAHLGLAELVWIAAPPLCLLFMALLPKPAMAIRLSLFGLSLWSLALKARGIRDEYGVGGGRAWLTLGAPFLALVLFVLLASFLAVLGFTLAALKS